MFIPDWVIEEFDFRKTGLYFVGLGLGELNVLTVEILYCLKSSNTILIDGYTNFYNKKIVDQITKYTNKEIELIDRFQLENDAEKIVELAKTQNVSLLVSGDPFLATTHTTMRDMAIEMGVNFKILNNASVFSVSVSRSGLSAYKFGKTPTLPFPNARSAYPYHVIEQNKSIGCHTLVLLDINVKEEKFLDIKTAIEEIEELEKQEEKKVLTDNTIVIGMVKIGMNDEKIIAGKIPEIKNEPWKEYGPPQCLIVCGDLHFAEIETLNLLYKLNLPKI